MNKILFFSIIFLCCCTSALSAQTVWSQTDLPASRLQMGAASLGSKVYFAGGFIGNSLTHRVDIYDTRSGAWTEASLSEARILPAGVAVGNKVIFAGGMSPDVSATVDIFDTTSGQWTIARLSEPRFSIAALSYGTKVLFAGGADLVQRRVTARVDVYDAETGVWTLDSLSEARSAMAAAVVGDKAIFAGGYRFNSQVSARVDIYDFGTGRWDTATLSQPRGMLSAAVATGKVIIAGGLLATNAPTDRVDIYNAESGHWSTDRLSEARGFIDNGAAACGKAFFAGGCMVDYQTNFINNPNSTVDIYDPISDRWSVEHLSHAILGNVVVSAGDQLFSAGGSTNPGSVFADLSTIDVYTCPGSATVERFLNNTALALSPNPAADIIRVHLKSATYHLAEHLRLFNMQGTVVLDQTAFPDGGSLVVSNIPRGFYILEWVDAAVSYRAPVLLVD